MIQDCERRYAFRISASLPDDRYRLRTGPGLRSIHNTFLDRPIDAERLAGVLRPSQLKSGTELLTISKAKLVNDGEPGFCVHRWSRGQQHRKNRVTPRPEAGHPD
jgi:hypothetical protein